MTPGVAAGAPCPQAGRDASTADGKLFACQADANGVLRWVEITTGGDGDALPKTGVDSTVAAAAGLALLLAGGTLYGLTRRRRFQA